MKLRRRSLLTSPKLILENKGTERKEETDMHSNVKGVDSVLVFKRIPMVDVYPTDHKILLDSAPIREYADGKVTDTVIGQSYTCVDPMNYEHIVIKVKGQTEPLLGHDEIIRRRESGEKLYVTFDNAVVTPYIDTHSNILRDSFSADDVHLVDVTADEI